MRVLLVFLAAVAMVRCRPSGEAKEAENQHQESRAALPCKADWAEKDLSCKMDVLYEYMRQMASVIYIWVEIFLDSIFISWEPAL